MEYAFSTTALAVGDDGWAGEYASQKRSMTCNDVLEYFGMPEFTDAVDVILARDGDARLIGQLFIAARDLYARRAAEHWISGDSDVKHTGFPNSPSAAVAMVLERALTAKSRRQA